MTAATTGTVPAGPSDPLALASEVGLTIAAMSDLGEMLSVIARRVAESLHTWGCSIYEYRSDSRLLVPAAFWAQEVDAENRAWLGTTCSLDESTTYKRLIEERIVRELYRDDPSLAPVDAAFMDRWRQSSALSVPLVFSDQVLGVLTLVEKGSVRRFSGDDLRLLELLAVPAAVAVHSGADAAP